MQNDVFEAQEYENSPVNSEYDECETTEETCSSEAASGSESDAESVSSEAESVSSASSASSQSSSAASEYVQPLKCVCECGRTVQYQTISKHRKSIIHRRIMYEKDVAARGLISACIYQICAIDEPADGLVYIGSTERGKALYKRIGEHRARWRRPFLRQYASRFLFEKYGPTGCKIIPVKHVLVKDKNELHRHEQEAIELFGERCVNIRRAIRNDE